MLSSRRCCRYATSMGQPLVGIWAVLLKEALDYSLHVPSHADLSEAQILASLSSNHHPWLQSMVRAGLFAKQDAQHPCSPPHPHPPPGPQHTGRKEKLQRNHSCPSTCFSRLSPELLHRGSFEICFLNLLCSSGGLGGQ